MPSLDQTERLARLRLIRSENVGPITYRELISHLGSAERALEALPDLARRGGNKRAPKVAPQHLTEKEMEAAERLGMHFIFLGTPEYPQALSNIEDAPPVLTIAGDPAIICKPCLGIVGARNASANGIRFAEAIARELGAGGLVIASGLARGIDTAAHKGALDTGTVAVVAGGADVIYPRENDGLYRNIVERGAVLTEMPLGLRPQARHFPRRNRLISGLSYGTLVVEAALRSGSLITARLALEQGRDVFAVPGSPQDPRHRGTNNLIRQGAALTERADDIFEALERVLNLSFSEPRQDLEPDRPPEAKIDTANDHARGVVLEKLGAVPVEVDEIVRQTGLTPAEVLTILLELELAGRVDRQPGNKVSLIARGEV